ncbi:MAG TPA: hypothetical protein VGH20_13415 [Myxococcales bacterium]|jgi:hypothetical protein
MRLALLPLVLAAFVCAACSDNTDVCNNGPSDVGAICVPSPLAPGITSTIQLRELCGRGCSDLPSCTAIFRNAQVILDVNQTTCNSQLTAACLQLGCQTRSIPCALPALAEGDYTLLVPGGATQILRVRSGGSSSCRLGDLDGGVP